MEDLKILKIFLCINHFRNIHLFFPRNHIEGSFEILFFEFKRSFTLLSHFFSFLSKLKIADA